MQATHHCNGDLAAHTQIIDCDLALLPLPLEARAERNIIVLNENLVAFLGEDVGDLARAPY
jgi:hypothetical protein